MSFVFVRQWKLDGQCRTLDLRDAMDWVWRNTASPSGKKRDWDEIEGELLAGDVLETPCCVIGPAHRVMSSASANGVKR